ncbi:MAG: SPOR domain-containing protein [Treponema sp.]|jgi:DedD protein|nr:SPOR domain-containing protein [Treponema sp.]
MEKKKIILVAVSVGVFLAIAISAAILIVAPKASGTNAAAVRPVSPGLPGTYRAQPDSRPSVPAESSRTQPATVDAVDMVRNADGIQAIQPPPQATAIQENHFYINGENTEDAYRVESAGEPGTPSKVVINIPKPSTAAVPDVPAGGKTEQPAPAARPRPRPAQARETPAPAPARPAARTASPAAVKSAAAVPAQKDYWVQTGAFSAKVRAEGARETLASRGIASIIENRELDGKTWYRVRVGPYTSENEANYWLSLVKTIDGFGESQIRLSGTKR